MTLEELQQQVDRDFKLDDTELDAESVKIPLLHNKYLQHFNKFSLLLKKAEYDYKTYLKQVVTYLEQVLRSINNRTFLIKNAIEWKKFTSGAI